MKNYTYVFTLFTFFENPTFYVFSVVAHVFSNTGDVGELADSSAGFLTQYSIVQLYLLIYLDCLHNWVDRRLDTTYLTTAMTVWRPTVRRLMHNSLSSRDHSNRLYWVLSRRLDSAMDHVLLRGLALLVQHDVVARNDAWRGETQINAMNARVGVIVLYDNGSQRVE